MKNHWKTFVAGMAFLVLMAFSNTAKADGINFSLNVDADDEAHFHFKAKENRDRERHNPKVWEAARNLRDAKHKLWVAGGPDFGGHRVKAIQAINRALEELWLADQYDVRHPDVKEKHRGHRDNHRERPQF